MPYNSDDDLEYLDVFGKISIYSKDNEPITGLIDSDYLSDVLKEIIFNEKFRNTDGAYTNQVDWINDEDNQRFNIVKDPENIKHIKILIVPLKGLYKKGNSKE